MKRVLVFGTFDGLHEGHLNMLRQAKQLGDWLVASVAIDEVVRALKGKSPKYPLKTRIGDLKKARIADDVVAGDEFIRRWDILKRVKPDVIALGYDQEEIKGALEDHFQDRPKRPTIVMLKSHKPDKYKSSILNQ